MNRIVVLMIGALLATGALAKLPEMTEEQKAAAAEKKAKAAEGDKKAAELLAASQDAVAGKYIERMKAQGITKSAMAERMKTSRRQLDRLLDPSTPSVTLETLRRAANAVGRTLRVELT